jgi:prohibitin 1
MISSVMQKVGNSFVELRKIEASKEIASTLDSNKNISYIPMNGSNGGFLWQVPAQ